MAEGEFVLIPAHLEAALQRPAALASIGSAASDLDLLALVAEHAAEENAPDLLASAGRALAAALEAGHPLYEGVARRALAVAHRQSGDWAAAEAELKQALDLFRSLPARWQAARTLAEGGLLEQARGRPDQARAALELARVEFEALGAAPDAARARANLAAL